MRLLLCLCLLLNLITITGKAQYYFIFKARGVGEAFRDCEGKAQRSYSGHVFVSLVRRDEALQQTIVDSTWGFTPNQRGLMAMVSTPGHLETTCIGDLGSADFIVEIDRATYEYAKNLKSKWVAKQYGIFANVNCVDYVKAMLELVTPEVKLPEVLKVNYLYPGTGTGAALLKQWYRIPKPFLNNLKQLNLARDKAARQSLANLGEPSPVAANSTFPSDCLMVESKPKPPVAPRPKNNNLLGGKTPEELGRMMFKAIQTNNFNIWIRFIHPSATEEDRRIIIGRLAKYRTQLEEQGLTDWSQVEFSQVTFKFGNSADHSVPFGKVAYYFTVKFYYKKREYLGSVDLGSIATEPNKEIYYVYRISIGSTHLFNNTGLVR